MDSQSIRRVRSFNRAVTKAVGALDQSYLERGRPLGEARVLFEIGAEGADAKTLRARLGLDFGLSEPPAAVARKPGSDRGRPGRGGRAPAPREPHSDGPGRGRRL